MKQLVSIEIGDDNAIVSFDTEEGCVTEVVSFDEVYDGDN